MRLEASAAVKEAVILKTDPGEVTVYLQGIDPPVPSAAIQTAVETYLDDDARRFICDTVLVEPVGTVSYSITATIGVHDGYVPSEVLTKVKAAVTAFGDAREIIGQDIPLSAIYAEMSVDEVSRSHT